MNDVAEVNLVLRVAGVFDVAEVDQRTDTEGVEAVSAFGCDRVELSRPEYPSPPYMMSGAAFVTAYIAEIFHVFYNYVAGTGRACIFVVEYHAEIPARRFIVVARQGDVRVGDRAHGIGLFGQVELVGVRGGIYPYVSGECRARFPFEMIVVFVVDVAGNFYFRRHGRASDYCQEQKDQAQIFMHGM